MTTASHFLKKVLAKPELAQIPFKVAVLDKYLASAEVKRTDTVGRVKTPTWSLDFGIAPGEQTIHVALTHLITKLPESERDHWLEFADDAPYSVNFLKMQSSHSCIDDGGYRNWGEEDSLF